MATLRISEPPSDSDLFDSPYFNPSSYTQYHENVRLSPLPFSAVDYQPSQAYQDTLDSRYGHTSRFSSRATGTMGSGRGPVPPNGKDGSPSMNTSGTSSSSYVSRGATTSSQRLVRSSASPSQTGYNHHDSGEPSSPVPSHLSFPSTSLDRYQERESPLHYLDTTLEQHMAAGTEGAWRSRFDHSDTLTSSRLRDGEHTDLQIDSTLANLQSLTNLSSMRGHSALDPSIEFSDDQVSSPTNLDVEQEALSALKHLTNIIGAVYEGSPDLMSGPSGETLKGLIGARQNLISWIQSHQSVSPQSAGASHPSTPRIPSSRSASNSTSATNSYGGQTSQLHHSSHPRAIGPSSISGESTPTSMGPVDQDWSHSTTEDYAQSQWPAVAEFGSSSSEELTPRGRTTAHFQFSSQGASQPIEPADEYGSFDTSSVMPVLKKPKLGSPPPSHQGLHTMGRLTHNDLPSHNPLGHPIAYAPPHHQGPYLTMSNSTPAWAIPSPYAPQAMDQRATNDPRPMHHVAPMIQPAFVRGAAVPQFALAPTLSAPYNGAPPPVLHPTRAWALPNQQIPSHQLPQDQDNPILTKPNSKPKRPQPPVSTFRVNPSKSTPLPQLDPRQPNQGLASGVQAKVPQSLAHVVPPGMMETFDWRKPVRARKKSRIATTAPEGTAQLSDFEMLSLLGTGTFGKVQLCLHSTTRQYYCMKILQKQTIYRFKQMDHVENEKLLLSTLKSPGIVQLFATFTTPESLMLLMEYVPGGELFFYIRKYGRLPEDVARFYAAELVLVILYLHERKVVYRDLKPENILLDVQGRLKLADFGFAKRVEDKTWTMCGTPDYLAPEIITGRGHDTAVDWWSLGVLIFEMLAGYPPFTDKDMATLFRKIQQPERLLIPSDFSQDATDLLRRLLVVDPSRRLGNIHPDISDIRTHPWFRPIDWDQLNKRNGTGPIVPVLQNAGDVGNFQDHDQPELPAPPPVSIPDDVQRVFDRF